MCEFIVACKQAIERLKVGNFANLSTDVSNRISKKEQERTLSWIQEAIEGGAEIVVGRRIKNGILLSMLLKNTDSNTRAICEEIFAPVVNVNHKGIRTFNDSGYDL